MAVFHRQRPTRFDKRGNLTIVLTLKMHAGAVIISMGKIVGGAVRRDLVAKIKIANFFFLACSLVIRKNLCLRKFPAIQYYFEQNN